jgi:hypothetical protein
MITAIQRQDYRDAEERFSQLLRSRHSGLNLVSSFTQATSREKADWMPDHVRHDERPCGACCHHPNIFP